MEPGKLWTEYAPPEGSAADFAVRVEGHELEPYVESGGIALLERGAQIKDGDVGLFFARGQLLFRQYCEDWAGNVHLLAVNRKLSELDLMLPRSRNEPVCCFGKLITEKEIPLP